MEVHERRVPLGARELDGGAGAKDRKLLANEVRVGRASIGSTAPSRCCWRGRCCSRCSVRPPAGPGGEALARIG